MPGRPGRAVRLLTVLAGTAALVSPATLAHAGTPATAALAHAGTPATATATATSARAGAVAAGPGTNFAIDDPFTAQRTQWWRQDRFGMFIHFGAYSQLEGEYKKPDGTICRNAEWIKKRCAIPMPEYEKIAATFNPSQFDAAAIVKAAKDAGQRYIVITSKHHDGYAMWPTKANTWNLRDHSSFDRKRDILAELKTEATKQGIKLGLYYSIWDWHDPDFPSPATFPRYKKRMWAQLKELIDNYDPALLWFDGQWTGSDPVNSWTAKDGEELEAYLRGLSPDLIINNRIGKKRVVDGDYGTPEQTIPAAPVEGQPWETCMTINGSWGFARWDSRWKSSTVLTRNLIDIASRSGTYLLNVGPDKLGRIPAPAVDRLRQMGSWLGANGQGATVYQAGHTGLVAPPAWGAVSWAPGEKLNASVYQWPGAGKSLHLTVRDPFAITAARILGSGQSVRVKAAGDGYDLTPSGAATNPVATVIELSIKREAPAPRGTGTGLTAEYFANSTLSGPPAATRTDPTVNFAWKFSGSPAPNIPVGTYSGRWTGSVQPRTTDTYTFLTVSDDTARLWVDGKLVIDDGTPHDPRVATGSIALQAGRKYAIKLEHTQLGGEGYLKLLWSSPNSGQQIVPQSQLYPAGP